MYKLKGGFALFTIYILLLCGCSKPVYHSPSLTNPSSAVTKSLSNRTHYVGLIVADFDNDGLLDIAEAKYPSGEITIKMGSSRSPLPTSLKTKGEVLSLEAADFNNDGKTDILFSGGKKNPGIHVFLNNENEWILREKITDKDIYLKIKAGDFNNDGKTDIAALLTNIKTRNSFKGGIRIWAQNENSKLVRIDWKHENPFQDFAVGDTNSDGNLDIVAADFEPYGGIKVFLGDGNGKWTPSANPPAINGNFLSVTVSDFNNDGTSDIIAGSFIHGIKIWLNQDHFGWKEYPTPTKRGSFWHIVNVDINHDGIKDIFAASFDSHGIRVWLSTHKDHPWKKGPDYLPSFSTLYSLSAFDVDKDHKIDLLGISHGKGIRLYPLSREIKKKYFLAKGSRGNSPGSSMFRRISYETIETGYFPDSNPKNFTYVNKIERPGQVIIPSELDKQSYIEIDGVPEYIVGPRDVLFITSWLGRTPTETKLTIREDGRISYYFLDDLLVKNMTVRQIDNLITKKLQRYIKDPRIDVRVEKFLSKKITIMGEWNITTHNFLKFEHFLEGKITLLEFIWKAGGVRPSADMTNVTLYRSDKIRTFDFSKALTETVSENPVLQGGDRVLVPKDPFFGRVIKKKVFILGEVGGTKVIDFSKELDITEAITRAGGTNPITASKYASVIRGDFANPKIIPVDLIRLFRHGDLGQNIMLQDGDIVFVSRSNMQLIEDYLKKIQNLANSLIFVGLLRDTYTSGGSFLRFNTGGTAGGLDPSDAFQP